uniref:Gustatory receptor n=1 Tax=Phlebotomus papatasi TaxID=29031 RepID=A0A3F2ZEK4_PHLPP
MAFTDKLGVLFIFQKFLLLPNYKADLEKNIIILAFRLLPTIILILFALKDVFEAYSDDESNIAELLITRDVDGYILLLDILTSRCGIIALLLLGFAYNRKHILLIKSVQEVEDNLYANLNFPQPLCMCFNFRIYLDIAVNSFINFIINVYYKMNFDSLTLSDIKRLIFDTIFMFANDIIILYLIHFIKKVSDLFVLLRKNINTVEERDEKIFQYMDNLIRIVPLINACLGAMIFILIILLLFNSVVATYFLYTFTFEFDIFLYYPLWNYITIIGCVWVIRSVSYVGYFSFAGSKFTEELEELFITIRHIESECERKKRIVMFNIEQFQMRRLHSQTAITIGGTYEINTSGIFVVISVTASYLLVLIQFRQLEDLI